MKKFLTIILGAAAITCCAAGLTACKKKTTPATTPSDSVYITVTGATINDDGELIISYADGTSQNLGKVKGEDGTNGKDGQNGQNGSNGTDGNGILSAIINSNGDLILTYSNGTVQNLGKVRGENGSGGNSGKGIVSTVINSDGELIITYSDGTSQNLGKVKGEDGSDGNDGVATPCAHTEYSDWQTEIQATCTANGVSTRTCTACGHIDYQFTPATGHDFSGEEIEILPVSCSQVGLKLVSCLNCTETTTVTTPALPHSYQGGRCTVCGGNEHEKYFSFTLNDDETGYSLTVNKSDRDKVSGVVHIPSEHNGLPVTELSNNAFWDCNKMTGAVIPDSVEKIGHGLFSKCNSLESIIVEDNPVYYSRNNCIIETATKTLIAGCKSSVIPASGAVTKIGESAFSYCNITSLVIPNGVTEIDKYAFSDCDELTYVSMHDSLSVIGYGAFYRCSKLATVIFPENLTIIGELAFYQCYEITSVSFNENLTEIGASAFLRCSKLASITLPDNLQYIGEAAFGSTAYDINHLQDKVRYIGKHLIYVYWEITDYTIRDGTLTIAEGAFEQASKIETVTIPDTVVTICKGAFYNCDYLQSITIPGNVVTIGEFAFFDCDELQSVTICDGVKTIGGYAFASCDRVNSINIPDSVTSIGGYAFVYNNLKTVVIGTGVESIGYGAFSQNYNADRTVEFKDPEGWVRYSPNAGELEFSAETLEDGAAASELLNETFISNDKTTYYKWYKNTAD